MSSYQDILVEREGAILWITINRPAALNALTPLAHRELSAAFDTFAAEAGLRVAILTGTGERSFCVGSDLKSRAERNADDHPPSGFAGLTHRFDLLKPVIAGVNGLALGGGGLQRLARNMPLKHAMDLVLTSRRIGASEAKQIGLINEVVPRADLKARVRQVADMIIACAPLAIEASKQVMLQSLQIGSLEAALRATYPAAQRMLASEDAKEGQRAFVEKRKPNWQGR